jgi:hypothetical protein
MAASVYVGRADETGELVDGVVRDGEAGEHHAELSLGRTRYALLIHATRRVRAPPNISGSSRR